MSDQRDAFEVLRQANPVPGAEAGGLARLVPDDVLAAVLAGGREQPARRRRRRIAVSVGVVAALATVGWTMFTSRTEPSKPLTVGCYAAADLDGRIEIAVLDGGTPEEVCAGLWQRGVFGAGPTPPLVACVLQSGTVAVLPGTGARTCAAVEAVALRGGNGGNQPDPVALRQSLVAALRSSGCVSVPRAVELVEGQLAEGGYRSWTVEVAGDPGPDRPCASLAFDVPRERVLVVPGPPVPAGGAGGG